MTTPLCRIARETGGDVPLDCLFGCPHRCGEPDPLAPHMRVIIAGSRGIEDYRLVDFAMATARVVHGIEPTEIVSGAARGVDTLGERWARLHHVRLKQFPVTAAEWRAIGGSAGHRRNAKMAEYADALVAVWDGRSPGTRGMIRLAHERNLKVYVLDARLVPL